MRSPAATLLCAVAVLAAAADAASEYAIGSEGASPNLATEMATQGAVAEATPPPTPRATCGPGSVPEPGMQGRVPAEAVAAGKADDGFRCNTELLGRHGNAGGFKVLRFVDKAGHECAYYDTTLLFPSNAQFLGSQQTGVAVLDMSDPSKPVQTAALSTLAMQTPHESLLLNERRGLLVAVMGNPIFAPGVVDVYDLNEDCREPALQSSLPVGLLGHESGFAPDGMTFYATSLFTGQVTAVDLTDPTLPTTLWVGQYNSHGLTLSNDGNRAYVADTSGLIILDVSEVQARKPNPQVTELSRLTWDTLTIPQVALPVTIGGRPFLVEIDEYSTGPEGGSLPAANGARVGAGRIIDISNEKAPKVVSDIRLEVHQPENRDEIAEDPGADNSLQGYAGHYCSVPQRKDPGVVACSFIASGLRLFDIRDPHEPKEIAYYVAPLGRDPSPTGGPPSNYAMSAPALVPERGEIWYSDGNSGFYAVRVVNGVWPFQDSVPAPTARTCLPRRAAIGSRGVAGVRLGASRGQLQRVLPSPARRSSRALRWCVKNGRGRVSAVFSRRGRARLVVTTAAGHRARGVRRGTRVRRMLRLFPSAHRVARKIYRAGLESRRVFGVRRRKVSFVGLADRRLLRAPKELRRLLRRAGVRVRSA